MVVDLDKKVLKRVLRKERIERKRTWKLNDNRTRVKFENRAKELVRIDAPDLSKTFMINSDKLFAVVCHDKTQRRKPLEEKKPNMYTCNLDLRFYCDQSGHRAQKCLQVVKTHLIVTFIFKNVFPKNPLEMLNCLMKQQQNKWQ